VLGEPCHPRHRPDETSSAPTRHASRYARSRDARP
jgi:hypothetical protein